MLDSSGPCSRVPGIESWMPPSEGARSVLPRDLRPSSSARRAFPRPVSLLCVSCLAPAGPWLWNLRDRLALPLSVYSALIRHVHFWGQIKQFAISYPLVYPCFLGGGWSIRLSILSSPAVMSLRSLFPKLHCHVEDLRVSQADSHGSPGWWEALLTPVNAGAATCPEGSRPA